MTNNEALKAYSFSYTVEGKTFTDWQQGEDMIDAALKVMEGFRMEGLKVDIFNMELMSWDAVELFGLTHLMVGDDWTLCGTKLLSKNKEGSLKIHHVEGDISCDECLTPARLLKIPTAGI